MAGAKAIIQKILDVLSVFLAKRLPVFHVMRVHRQDGADVEIIRQKLFKKIPFAIEGMNGADVIDELSPWLEEYVIKKTRLSALSARGLT